MKLLFPPGQNYDCLRCGKGCRRLARVHVDPYSERRLAESGLGARWEDEHGRPAVREEPDGARVAARRDDGSCGFLREDGLCRVQAELGVEAKPLGCRQFPLFLRPTPEGLVVGVSFFCTAVQQNHGRPLEDHAEEIREILRGIRFRPLGFEPLDAGGGAGLEWQGYRRIEEHLAAAADLRELGERSGRALGALARLAEPGRLLQAQDVETALREEAGDLLADPVVAAQEDFFLAALVVFSEPGDPARRPEVTRALLEGAPVELPSLGWRGTAPAAVAASEPFPAGQAERYLRGLLHRKFLALDRPVLDNLALFRLLPNLLRFYAGASACARGSASCEEADLFRALDLVELELVSHANGLDGLFGALGAFYLERARA